MTELVRVDPDNFRMRTFVPRGLSDTGRAFFAWIVLNPNSEPQASELFELVPRAAPVTDSNAVTQTEFILRPEDHSRFQRQQVLQRAQLLAGYIAYGMSAGPDLCDTAGISVRGSSVYSVLSSSAGPSIATFRLPSSASELERVAPFCI